MGPVDIHVKIMAPQDVLKTSQTVIHIQENLLLFITNKASPLEQ
ncbi:hypothetical protein, partial, partial [Parasitella parasitica]